MAASPSTAELTPRGHALASSRLSLRRVALWILPLAFLAVFFFLPLGRILAFSIDPAALSASNLRLALATLGFTLYQAALSTLLTLAVGLPAAVLFAHYTFPGKALLRALTAVPFMLPTVVVAAGFSALLGPRGWLNLMLVRAVRPLGTADRVHRHARRHPGCPRLLQHHNRDPARGGGPLKPRSEIAPGRLLPGCRAFARLAGAS